MTGKAPSLRLGRSWSNVAILLAISAMMFMLIFLVWQTLAAERAQREQSRQTAAVLDDLRDIHMATVNAETGQRGFFLTMDRRYLEPYRMGREQLYPALARLRARLAANSTPRQAELVDQIDALSRAKFAEMQQSVEFIEQNRLLDARRAVLTDEGHEVMERLRRSLSEMEVIEGQILARQNAATAEVEARILPLLAMLILLLLFAIVLGARLVSRTARAEVEAAKAAAVGEAWDRADLLARELNHRVKNLFAVILAIVQMSARDRPEAKDVTENIAQRIRALLTAHEVSQGELDRPVASLEALVETTLAPYRSSSKTARITGPLEVLPARVVTPLGLVLHELTTNAVKYGAWAKDGDIAISWDRAADNLIRFVWREHLPKNTTIAAGEPGTAGFGSQLMTSAARQLGGTIERRFLDDGLEVVITIPNEAAA